MLDWALGTFCDGFCPASSHSSVFRELYSTLSPLAFIPFGIVLFRSLSTFPTFYFPSSHRLSKNVQRRQWKIKKSQMMMKASVLKRWTNSSQRIYPTISTQSETLSNPLNLFPLLVPMLQPRSDFFWVQLFFE